MKTPNEQNDKPNERTIKITYRFAEDLSVTTESLTGENVGYRIHRAGDEGYRTVSIWASSKGVPDQNILLVEPQHARIEFDS